MAVPVFTILASSFYVFIVLLYSFRYGRPNLPVAINIFKILFWYYVLLFIILLMFDFWSLLNIEVIFLSLSVTTPRPQFRVVTASSETYFLCKDKICLPKCITSHLSTLSYIYYHPVSLGPSPFFTINPHLSDPKNFWIISKPLSPHRSLSFPNHQWMYSMEQVSSKCY